MRVELENKCALITGSVQGLGHSIAEHLAQSGCHIVLHGLEPAEKADAAARRLRERYGRRVLLSRADLTQVDQIEEMIEAARGAFGRVDIVVNNAVVRHFSPVEALSADQWQESIAVNLSAAFHICRLVIPGMRENRWGRIINISSVYGARGATNRIGYVTTKTALLGMTRAIALETAAAGITCNAVSPGTAPTPPILDRIATMAQESGITVDEATRQYLGQRQPTGRFVAPDKVAALIAFLCSDNGCDITGATFPIDGGWTAA